MSEPNPRPGLTSATTTAASAFLSSAASCNALVGKALGSRRPNGLSAYLATKFAYEAWAVQCKKESMLPFQAFSSERPPKQQTITALVHRKKSEEITPGSTRLQIMRNSIKLPEAKTWVNCRPSSGYATYIPTHHFKVWLQYFCQVPLFQPGPRCTRPQCAAALDIYGDHLLYCLMSGLLSGI